MEDLLNELKTRSGIRAVFICDLEGHMLASALSDDRITQTLGPLSSIINRTNSALMTLKHGSLEEAEWVYSGGRVLVRGLGNALLCLICERSINLQLLTMKLEEIQNQVQAELGNVKREPTSEDIARLKQGMIAIAEEMLGEHAGKVIEIVKVSGDTLEKLEQACEQAEKVTRLFIDRKKAGDMDARMRELLETYR